MKKMLRALLISVSIIVPLGSGTFLLYLFGSLGIFPLRVTKVIPVLGIAAILALVLISTGYLEKKGRRVVTCAFFVVCAFSVGWIAYGAYEDSLPVVEDRELMVLEYQPFRKRETHLAILEEEASFRLENAWRLRLDGATALYPVYAAFVQAVYPEGDYSPFRSQVECSGTADAYRKLIHGETDMIFVAGPSAAQLEAAQKAGVTLHLTPVGKEAFVFFVNSRNPVTELTVEQVQGIYSGQITNWKHLGGKLQPIRAFQRAENSGSQTALQNLMAGLPLMEPEEEERIAGMGGIIREVARYRNHRNAIGFTFRYYATEMVDNGDIRLLAINGVDPVKETIRDGSYPIASEFYAVTASPVGEPPPQERDAVMRNFLEWVLSEQGQYLVEETGYVSLR